MVVSVATENHCQVGTRTMSVCCSYSGNSSADILRVRVRVRVRVGVSADILNMETTILTMLFPISYITYISYVTYPPSPPTSYLHP